MAASREIAGETSLEQPYAGVTYCTIIIAVIVCAAFVAALWAIRVPPFQAPDEVAHADYAFTFFDAGKPFWSRRSVSANYVTPQVRYLVRATDYRRMRYDAHATVSSDYGLPAWKHRIDAGAPARTLQAPHDGSKLPYVMFAYPPFYYMAVAAVMSATWNSSGHSLIVAFFAGRLFNVCLLVATLITSLYILTELRFSHVQRILILIALGLFPLSSSVSSSIQPDNQSTLLIALAWLAALRVRRNPTSVALLVALTVCEVALALTKIHYASIAICAIGLGLRSAFPARMRLQSIALIVLVPLAALFAEKYTLPGGWFGGPTPATNFQNSSPGASAYIIVEHSLHAVRDIFGGGFVFDGFWFHFGIRAGSAFAGSTLKIVSLFLVSATGLSMLAIGATQLSNVRRISAIGSNKGFFFAWRFIANDIALNLYLALTGFLIALYVFTGGGLTLQGRYWYPTLLPLIVISVNALSRAIGHSHVRRLVTPLCALWATYSLIASPCALLAMNRDYYVPTYEARSTEVGELTRTTVNTVSIERDGTALVQPNRIVVIEGVALDSSLGEPAGDVRFDIDGGSLAHARVARRNPALSQIFNDPKLLRAGFDVRVPTKSLSAGLHTVRFFSVEHRGREKLYFAQLRFKVVAR